MIVKVKSLAFSVLLLLLVACTTLPTPSPTPQAAATPTTAPTTLTRLSPSAREALVEFARKHQKITEEWEQLHLDFDQWVQGNLVCGVSSMQVALAQFAGDFARITERAQDLPRSSNVKHLADKLITAAEDEDEALRELMRTWQPGTQDIFERVELQQSNSVAIQKVVEDALVGAKEEASIETRGLLDNFSDSLGTLNEDWDTFHRDYDTFRSEQMKLFAAERAVRLSRLVSQFGELVIQVRNLPTSQLTRHVVDILVEAAEQEDLALRKLRDAFEEEQAASAESTPLPGGSVFEDFDTQLVNSNTQRREATEKLADIVKSSSVQNEQAVEGFTKSYDELRSLWKAFHQGYGTWRSTDGGCDRSQVVEILAQFSFRFSQLAKEVRALPRLPILQPLGEVLVEAAEGEDEAFKSLRDTWRPFNPDVYSPFQKERIAAGKLRRQVDAGVNQLLTQYAVSLQELTG